MKRLGFGVALAGMLMAQKALVAQAAACPMAEAGYAGRCVMMTVERLGVMVPVYTILVREDGKLKYWESGNAASAGAQRAAYLPVSSTVVATVLASADSIRSGACMAHVRSVGLGGKSTMTVWTAQGTATCSFASSTDPSVSAASSAMQAMAEMIQGGERVTRDHRGDRLALEGDLDELTARAHAGKAIEPQLIAAALNEIAGDETLVDRVRQKATDLLHSAPAGAVNAR